jgi:DHHC palmitoyltransferase
MACFQSPGVVLSSDYDYADDDVDTVTTSTIVDDKDLVRPDLQWKASKGQGGIWGIDSKLNVEQERLLTSTYIMSISTPTATKEKQQQSTKQPLPAPKSSTPTNTLVDKDNSRSNNSNITSTKPHRVINLDDVECFPSLNTTSCNKCQIQDRPSRCHHCSVCDRCVLEFDHHCVWLNNCVGYNNKRHFVLTLVWLTVGCWYGIAMLYKPFYVPLRQQIDEYGWQAILFKNGLLGLPTLTGLIEQIRWGTLESETMVKLVFPLLASVGSIQVVFLSYHIMYMVMALTTLEYNIITEWKYMKLVAAEKEQTGNSIPPSPSLIPPVNPFDSRSWIQNLRNTLGPLPLVFLPVTVAPKPPIVKVTTTTTKTNKNKTE